MCTVVLCIIVCVRKRKEVFIILTPIFIIIADVFTIVGAYIILTISPGDFITGEKETVNLLFTINNFFSLMSYQVFGA